ncbi:MAG: hypothetical protein V2A59_04710, partial [Candidatus Omnitrophota bacterium]
MSNWREQIWLKVVALTVCGVFLFSEVTWAARTDIGGSLPQATQTTQEQNPGFFGFIKQVVNSVGEFLLPEAAAYIPTEYGSEYEYIGTGITFYPPVINIVVPVPQAPVFLTQPGFTLSLGAWNALPVNLDPTVYAALETSVNNLYGNGINGISDLELFNYINQFATVASKLQEQVGLSKLDQPEVNEALINLAQLIGSGVTLQQVTNLADSTVRALDGGVAPEKVLEVLGQATKGNINDSVATLNKEISAANMGTVFGLTFLQKFQAGTLDTSTLESALESALVVAIDKVQGEHPTITLEQLTQAVVDVVGDGSGQVDYARLVGIIDGLVDPDTGRLEGQGITIALVLAYAPANPKLGGKIDPVTALKSLVRAGLDINQIEASYNILESSLGINADNVTIQPNQPNQTVLLQQPVVNDTVPAVTEQQLDAESLRDLYIQDVVQQVITANPGIFDTLFQILLMQVILDEKIDPLSNTTTIPAGTALPSTSRVIPVGQSLVIAQYQAGTNNVFILANVGDSGDINSSLLYVEPIDTQISDGIEFVTGLAPPVAEILAYFSANLPNFDSLVLSNDSIIGIQPNNGSFFVFSVANSNTTDFLQSALKLDPTVAGGFGFGAADFYGAAGDTTNCAVESIYWSLRLANITDVTREDIAARFAGSGYLGHAPAIGEMVSYRVLTGVLDSFLLEHNLPISSGFCTTVPLSEQVGFKGIIFVNTPEGGHFETVEVRQGGVIWSFSEGRDISSRFGASVSASERWVWNGTLINIQSTSALPPIASVLPPAIVGEVVMFGAPIFNEVNGSIVNTNTVTGGNTAEFYAQREIQGRVFDSASGRSYIVVAWGTGAVRYLLPADVRLPQGTTFADLPYYAPYYEHKGLAVPAGYPTVTLVPTRNNYTVTENYYIRGEWELNITMYMLPNNPNWENLIPTQVPIGTLNPGYTSSNFNLNNTGSWTPVVENQQVTVLAYLPPSVNSFTGLPQGGFAVVLFEGDTNLYLVKPENLSGFDPSIMQGQPPLQTVATGTYGAILYTTQFQTGYTDMGDGNILRISGQGAENSVGLIYIDPAGWSLTPDGKFVYYIDLNLAGVDPNIIPWDTYAPTQDSRGTVIHSVDEWIGNHRSDIVAELVRDHGYTQAKAELMVGELINPTQSAAGTSEGGTQPNVDLPAVTGQMEWNLWQLQRAEANGALGQAIDYVGDYLVFLDVWADINTFGTLIGSEAINEVISQHPGDIDGIKSGIDALIAGLPAAIRDHAEEYNLEPITPEGVIVEVRGPNDQIINNQPIDLTDPTKGYTVTFCFPVVDSYSGYTSYNVVTIERWGVGQTDFYITGNPTSTQLDFIFQVIQSPVLLFNQGQVYQVTNIAYSTSFNTVDFNQVDASDFNATELTAIRAHGNGEFLVAGSTTVIDWVHFRRDMVQ